MKQQTFPCINGDRFLEDLKVLISEHEFSELELYGDTVPRLPLCGVYFLFEDDELVYIGKSTNIYSRLGGHSSGEVHKTSKFNRVTAIKVDEKHLSAVELAFIAAYQPKLNGGIKQTGKQRELV